MPEKKPNFILDVWNHVKMPSLTTDFQKELFFEHILQAPTGSILETGVYYGADLFIAARTLDLLNRPGEVIGVDIFDPNDLYRHDPIWQANGLPGPEEQVHKFAEQFGLSSRIRTIKGDSLKVPTDTIPGLSVLVVDGAHDYEHARGDMDKYGRLMLPGGFMLVHDFYNSENEFWGVNRAVADYAKEHRNYLHYNIGNYAIFKKERTWAERLIARKGMGE